MREPVLRRTLFGCATSPVRTAVTRFCPSLASMFSCCALVLLTCAPLPLLAATDIQARDSIQSPKAATTLLLDITQAGTRLVAAGDRGHILYSDDAGSSWTQARVPPRQMLTAIHFVDAQHGWAVGHDALVLVTRDGGLTWTAQHEDREREAPLLDVWFADLRHGIAVGAYGALIETTDGGETWSDISDRLDNEDGYHLNAISHIEGSGLFIVGEMGSMFRSTDLGQSWERVEAPYEGSLFGVLGERPGVVLAFGLRGHLFRSDDFGTSWKQIEVNDEGRPLRSGLAGGVFTESGVVIVGHGGAVLTSRDGGRTFSVIHRGDRRSLASALVNERGELVLVGQGGVYLADATGEEPAQKQ